MVGIEPSILGANITYIGVYGGIENPSSGIPKLGQLTEWAMYKAYQGDGQVTEGSNLLKKVEFSSLVEIANRTSFRGSKTTSIPSNSEKNDMIIRKIHSLINKTKNSLKFLLSILKISVEFKEPKS